MCKFSDENKARLGNTVVFIAKNIENPGKTKILKLLYLIEEYFVLRYHAPFLGIPYEVWRLGPVTKDVFIDLSEGPFLLKDYVKIRHKGDSSYIEAIAEFDEDEFSDNELEVMKTIIDKYGKMSANKLVEITHKKGSFWYNTAKENDLLDAFKNGECNNSEYRIDFTKGMTECAADYYREQLEEYHAANYYNLQ